MAKKLNGTFVPVLDSLISRNGLILAAVYGKVWRICQARSEVCWASNKRIAADLALSDRTVRKHLATLVELGLLEAHSRPGKTVAYRVTGLADIVIEAESIREATPEIDSGVSREAVANEPPRKKMPRTPEIDSGVSGAPRKKMPRTPEDFSDKDTTKIGAELSNRPAVAADETATTTPQIIGGQFKCPKCGKWVAEEYLTTAVGRNCLFHAEAA